MAKGTNDLDTILMEIGQFGAFQIFSCFLICLPIIYNGVDTLTYVFTASGVEQRCRINGCDLDNSTSPTFSPYWLNFTVPFENGLPLKCKRYADVNSTEVEENNGFCSTDRFDQENIVACKQFVYKSEEKTIATEWDLSCPEDEWKLTLIGTLNNIGQFIGMPIGGYVSDRYGRRATLAITGTLSAIMGVLRSFSTNYAMFAAFETIDAAVGAVVYPVALVLGMELVGPEKRVLASTILALFYPVGEILLGVIAKYVNDWRVLLRVLYFPGLLHIFYFFVVTESIRWLLVKGRYTEAIRALKKVAKFNRVHLSEESLEELCSTTELYKGSINKETDESYPIRSAFQSTTLLCRIINCSFCWFTNTLVYYGLSLNSVSLAGDKYLNFILVCMAEVPGFLICYFTTNSWGRRPTQSATLIISGVACLLSFFVSDEQPWIGFALFLIGKLAITISFTVLYVYTSELFPTNLRQSLLSFCSMFGRIGSMIAPQTPLIAQIFPSFPLILFGSCAISSGVLVLRFPETLNTKLPTTIADAENIGENILDNMETEEITHKPRLY